tara:strand:- start:331 stop:501 length:171 start_codon:yes stop_codon:yes gene_type:complete
MRTLGLISALSLMACGPKKVTLEEALKVDRYPTIDEELTEDDIEELPEAGSEERDK